MKNKMRPVWTGVMLAASTLGLANAQSNVTVFGVVDLGITHISAGGKSASGVTHSGISSSRYGFRGNEDLGGGLVASFWLESSVAADSGGGPASGPGFDRRSFVSLNSQTWGEGRFGREYTPTFWNGAIYDPFGALGVGTSNTFAMMAAAGIAASNNINAVRANNSLSYLTPKLFGGFSAWVMYALPEKTPSSVKTDRFIGARLGYEAGPWSVHLAAGKTDGGTATANINANDTEYLNFGASYQFDMIKPMIFLSQEKNGAGAKVIAWQIGFSMPLGLHEFRGSFGNYDLSGPAIGGNGWDKLSLGYIYNLSKRTAVYATYARLDNSGAQATRITAQGLGTTLTPSAGGAATGYEFGLRHSF